MPFSLLKICLIYQEKIFAANIGLGDQHLLEIFFENFDFQNTYFIF